MGLLALLERFSATLARARSIGPSECGILKDSVGDGIEERGRKFWEVNTLKGNTSIVKGIACVCKPTAGGQFWHSSQEH